MNKNVLKKIVIYLCVTLLALAVYYVTLPAINLQSPDFWIFLAFLIFIYTAPYSLKIIKGGASTVKKSSKNSFPINFDLKLGKLSYLAIIPIAVVLVGTMISSTFFNARAYARVISVEESVFEEDMPETTNVTNIALMDTPSAQKLGDKKLGSLSEYVSQYVVSEQYNQINYEDLPKKVAVLEYGDFFKWLGNRAKGVPGYIMVDPVNNKAEYIELKTPLKYVESAFFGEDLQRKLRFSYPTKILGTPRYEIDDDGNPVYVVPCFRPRVSLFGAQDVREAIIFDPCTGESQIYKVGEIPEWVDVVFDGDIASQKYNWFGTLSGGYFNSVIGNRGCKQTTDDYGYLALDNDVWYFTGVTSVAGDESNIGFIISNARTGQYKYYPVIGASEHAAMSAAEGEVQNMRYVASFPALVNLYGQATYIMLLKDSSGIVKMTSLVNVEHYNSIIATGNNQSEAMKAYRDMLIEQGLISGTPASGNKKQITVLSVKERVIGGNTVFFFEVNENGQTVYYTINIADDQTAIFISAGDTINVTAEESGNDNIFVITSWSKDE